MQTGLPCARGRQRLAQRRFGIDIDNAVDAGGIELRVDVVDDGRRARLAGNIGQQREAGSCPCGTVEELASGRHVGRYRAAGFNNCLFGIYIHSQVLITEAYQVG